MQLQSALDAFAAAAVDPTRWDAAMEAIAAATDSFGALVVPVKGRLPSFPSSPSLARACESYIRDGWVHRDIRYRTVPVMARQGVATEADFISDNEIKRAPYYQEFLAPHGLRWWSGVKIAAGGDFWCLSLQRTIAQGPFSTAEQKILAAASLALGATAAIARALGFARAEGALAAFEASDTAVAMLSGGGEIVLLNASAERLIGQGLQIVNRRLACADRNSTEALDRALYELLWSANEQALLPPVILPRIGRRPLIAHPMRLPSVTRDIFAPCQAIVTLIDPENGASAPNRVWQAAFNLTPAETRLAAGIVDGLEIAAIADQLGIAKETTRAQLKAVFGKTQTHRQSELVALLGRIRNPYQS
jgi:DNA-binding CsgD family transcriptional regulator/PAS domain-containing protein